MGNSILKTDKWSTPYKDSIRFGKGFNVEHFTNIAGEYVKRICIPIQIGHTETPWAVLTNVPKKQIMAPVRSIMYTTIFIGAISLLVLLAVIFIITRSITTPLIKGSDFAKKMSDGDFTLRLDINQKDEIGILADALNSMTANLGAIFKDIMGDVEILHTSSSELAGISKQMSTGS